jgi:dipeptidase D
MTPTVDSLENATLDALLEAGPTQLLWKYFLELSTIPRGSKAEAAAAAWVAEQGRLLGCEVLQDEVGNVVIRKPATPGRENAPMTALQAHVDMVCEQNEGTNHDFLKDPLTLVREGDILRASGTTLGADNGIGVAAALAILAAKDVQHGPLEILITIDEETGLTGANNLKPGVLQSKYLLNLDSEEEGDLTIGCAGGIDSMLSRKVTLVAPGAGKVAYRLKVVGLKGGHSGMEINQNRGNSLRILGSLLTRMAPKFGLELAEITGGNKRNAIPREAFAIVFMDPKVEGEARMAVTTMENELRNALGAFDPGLSLSLEPVSSPLTQVFSAEDARIVALFLFTMLHGVIAMSAAIPGLVQTSTNLAMIHTLGDLVEISTSQRSSIESSKFSMADQVSAFCELAGFKVKRGDGYPGWQPNPTLPLVKAVCAVHEEVFGKKMGIQAIHAGLECGLIGEKYPEMEMVSFGPNMWDVHTPDEHVSIKSVANFWKLLVAVLEKV